MAKLCREKKYSEMIEEIFSAELKAFADIKNLLFDTEIGTNVLTYLIQKDNEDDHPYSGK